MQINRKTNIFFWISEYTIKKGEHNDLYTNGGWSGNGTLARYVIQCSGKLTYNWFIIYIFLLYLILTVIVTRIIRNCLVISICQSFLLTISQWSKVVFSISFFRLNFVLPWYNQIKTSFQRHNFDIVFQPNFDVFSMSWYRFLDTESRNFQRRFLDLKSPNFNIIFTSFFVQKKTKWRFV